ncbi:MAG: biotin--[acetyl-CoA-carboxylase] ligase [Sulfolobales archaeon]
MFAGAAALILSSLRSGKIMSGESIASELGVSRAYIHKVVDRLRKWGIPIVAEPGLGYYIPLEDDIAKTVELLNVVGVGASVTYTEKCVKSSQDIAKELAAAGAGSWTTVVCGEMVTGRGRLGRAWYAPRGGLWFTVIVRPEFTGSLHLLSLAAGVSVAESLIALLGVDARVKWPNDVLVYDRKVCGILVEGEAEADRIRLLYLGVGINANNELPLVVRETATTLRNLVGNEVPRATLLAVILSRLKTYYGYLSTEKVDKVIDSWKKLSATIGKTVRVVTLGGKEIVGHAIAVDQLGRLVVETSGTRYHIEAGDVYHLKH